MLLIRGFTRRHRVVKPMVKHVYHKIKFPLVVQSRQRFFNSCYSPLGAIRFHIQQSGFNLAFTQNICGVFWDLRIEGKHERERERERETDRQTDRQAETWCESNNFRHVTWFGLVKICRCFRRICHLHLQSPKCVNK
jgi:hypothetical protein